MLIDHFMLFIISTDHSLRAYNAVNMYLEKDLIEKGFRVLKIQE